MSRERSGFTPLYLLAALYVTGVYAFLPLLYLLNRDYFTAGSGAKMQPAPFLPPLLLPAALGLLNLISVIVLRRRTTRVQLLNCALAVKYALIPFYLAGGFCIAVALLLTFTPVIIMIFIGPPVAAILSAGGWIILLGSAPFSIGYLIKAREDKVHSHDFCWRTAFMQFFFVFDVVSVMSAAFAEKKWIRTTVTLLILLVAAILGAVIWMNIQIAHTSLT